MKGYDVIRTFGPSRSSRSKPAAFFDIDHTIIVPAKHKKMYSAKDDYKWIFMMANTVERLKNISKTHEIYFVTNQLKYDAIIKSRITEMMEQLKSKGVVSTALISTARDIHRKPGTGLLRIPGINPLITKESFHVGDALGRDGDFSDDDLWFGIHAGIQVYSPEEFFDENFDASQYGPIEYIRSSPVDTVLIEKLKKIRETFDGVMLMGLPGSGKSAIRKWYSDSFSDVGVFNNDEGLSAEPGLQFYVLDNINLTEKQRTSYPKFIQDLKLATIFVDLDPKDCIRGIKYRAFVEGGMYVPNVAINAAHKHQVLPKKIDLHLRSRPILSKDFPAYLLN